MFENPSCIHVLGLVSGKAAQINWESVDGAEKYILEHRFAGEDEVFPEEYETILFTDTPSPSDYDHGCWHNIAAASYSWGDIAEKNYSWKEIVGLNQGDGHLGCIDLIPSKVKFAEYRMKAMGPGGESDYTFSGRLSVKSKMDIADNISRFVTAGNRAYFTIHADSAHLFEDAMTVTYDPRAIELRSVTAHIPESGYEDSLLDIASQSSGQIELYCTRQIPNDMDWSGFITLLEFKALQTGETQLQLC